MQTPCKHTLYVAFENIMHYTHKRVNLKLGAYDELEDLKNALVDATLQFNRINIINFEIFRVSHHMFYAFVGFFTPNMVEPEQ